jgi:hypothetical protein
MLLYIKQFSKVEELLVQSLRGAYCNNYDRKRSELDTILRGSPHIALVPVSLLLLFTPLLNPGHGSQQELPRNRSESYI